MLARFTVCLSVSYVYDFCKARWHIWIKLDKLRYFLSLSFLSPTILIFVSSAVSVLTLIIKQPDVPSLPLLSTPKLTTVTLSTTIVLRFKSIASSRFRTVLHVLWLKLLNFSLITPILRSLHSILASALNINSSKWPVTGVTLSDNYCDKITLSHEPHSYQKAPICLVLRFVKNISCQG